MDCSTLDDSDLVEVELALLESAAPDERWQEKEVILIPVECNPVTNDGLCCRLVSHLDLQKYGRRSPSPSLHVHDNTNQNPTGETFTTLDGVANETLGPGPSGIPKPYGTAAVFHRVPDEFKLDNKWLPLRTNRKKKLKWKKKIRSRYAGSNTQDLRCVISAKKKTNWFKKRRQKV